jgi:hypothetical protein
MFAIIEILLAVLMGVALLSLIFVVFDIGDRLRGKHKPADIEAETVAAIENHKSAEDGSFDFNQP